MINKYMVLLLSLVYFGCVTPTTDNPADPEADSPLVFGESVMVPWGCMTWRQQSLKIPGLWNVKQKCCPLEPIVPAEEEPNNVDGWELKDWDC